MKDGISCQQLPPLLLFSPCYSLLTTDCLFPGTLSIPGHLLQERCRSGVLDNSLCTNSALAQWETQ